ncbi:MAG: fused MFS/spermidine synthase, partial [Vicinamibacterales bacterium]
MTSSLALVLLFVGSGTAALIYEVVWQQLLQLVIGSSTVSLGVLLGTYMGGMCLGSLYAPRLVPRGRHPLAVYAGLEAAIGAMGLLLLWGMPLVTRAYISVGGLGAGGVLMRALVAGICLVPPTFAMGATLPVMARWVDGTPEGRARLGYFYAGNLAGAVFGCLLTGFYLLRVFDMAVATYVAAAINLVVAAFAWRASRRHASLPERAATVAPTSAHASERAASARRRLYVVMAGSGFCALAAEVVWTRMLALLFGATVYTFSIVLAVFLIGLGIGSTAAAAWARRLTRPALWLGWAQLASVVGMVWSAHALSNVLPYWPPSDAGAVSIWAVFRVDFLRAAFAILPAPLFWGASFSLALAASGDDTADQGDVVGRLYAANTIGAIAGALLTSLVLVRWFGSQHAQQVMTLVASCGGALVLWNAAGSGRLRVVRVSAIVATLLLAFAVAPLPGVLVAYGRHAANWVSHANEIIYVGEGMHASIAVSRTEDGVLNYHNAGKVQASSQP